ncbi:MAG: zinc dependent phospholipase C family protein [candidate division Zixibacteria bacterium]|nr:zinc dependent phospholipase C family protein [candidate division Zixibacteria bacterium]
MPKYGVHEIILSKAALGLSNSSNSRSRVASEEIEQNKGIANLGAIGPDLFFWGSDYDAVKKLFQLYKNIQYVVQKYNEVISPITAVKDAIGTATDAVVGSLAPNTLDLVKQLVEQVKETATLFKATVTTGIFTGVLGISDLFSQIVTLPRLTAELFDLFSPPMQNQLKTGQPFNIKKWYWFDMLHYRRTGSFAKNLIEIARTGTPQQRAYAYGYLSHIATDVIGHGFVNQVVGGPYRLNIQRHVTMENYLDSWAYVRYLNGADVSKKLGENLRLPAPSELPSSIVQMLDAAFRNTYSNLYPTLLRDPGFYTQGEISTCYETFYTVLSMLEGMGVECPVEPFSNVADILNNALNDLLEAPPSPPDPPSSSCSWEDVLSFGLTESSSECYEQFFHEVAEWAEYMGELILWTFETLLDIIDLILTLLLSLPITVLLALLYGIQLLLYEIYQSVRSLLAQFGFVYPIPDELNTSIGQTLTSTILGCGIPFKYPLWRNNVFSHLVCPKGGIETMQTAPEFYIYSPPTEGVDFIENLVYNPSVLREYASAGTPQDTVQLEYNRKRIGNATDFAKWMITVAAEISTQDEQIAYTNWDLDSDRGYAYKTWNGRLDVSENKVVDETYVD